MHARLAIIMYNTQLITNNEYSCTYNTKPFNAELQDLLYHIFQFTAVLDFVIIEVEHVTSQKTYI